MKASAPSVVFWQSKEAITPSSVYSFVSSKACGGRLGLTDVARADWPALVGNPWVDGAALCVCVSDDSRLGDMPGPSPKLAAYSSRLATFWESCIAIVCSAGVFAAARMRVERIFAAST